MLINQYEEEGLIYKTKFQNIVQETFLKNHDESLKLNCFNKKCLNRYYFSYK